MIYETENGRLEVPFATHYFDSTAQAYNSSQTGYYRDGFDKEGNVDFEMVYVADGDLMVIPHEGVYGFLYGAWPLAVQSGNKQTPTGEFHIVGDVKEFFAAVSFDGDETNWTRYHEVYEVAKELHAMHYSNDVRTKTDAH